MLEKPRSLIVLYNNIRKDFGNLPELCAVNYECSFVNSVNFVNSGELLYNALNNNVLQKRKSEEHHFYNYLEHQMFSRLQEMKFYSEVNVFNTRRLVSVSPDCISMIQILIRKEIHIIVHFRSSDFDGALPADLEWIATLPTKLINHLTLLNYDEINSETLDKLSKSSVKLTLTFGSIHRTFHDISS